MQPVARERRGAVVPFGHGRLGRCLLLAGLAIALGMAPGCPSSSDDDDDDDAGDDDATDDDDDDDVTGSADDAEIEAHTLPGSLSCGGEVTATVTVHNTGTTTWTPEEMYRLGTVDDSDPLHPDSTRVLLPEGAAVAPGDSWTFGIDLVAPDTDGSYLTDWQMVREKVHWFGDVASQDVEVTCSMGPLEVSADNPRYFVDPSGNAVLLVGSHTWDNRQDWGGAFDDFDWTAYLDLLQEHGHNYIRLWVHEGTSNGGTTSQDVTPQIYERGGNGLFGLDALNDAFFERTRERVEDARDRGIYVGVMLFQGWSIRHVAWHYEPWPTHPMHASNNGDGIDGDLDGDGQGEEVHTLQSSAITALHETYVERMVTELNDLDNVLWEIANESHDQSVDWQYAMIDLIRDLEASLPAQHPVGMTYPNDASNDVLFDSDAAWISPSNDGGSDDWGTAPPVNDGTMIVLADNDHITNVLGSTSKNTYRDWIYKSVTRGHHVILMDAIQNPWPDLDTHDACDPDNEGLQAAREYLGRARDLADDVDLLALEPSSSLASTGYCLADPGNQMVVYQPDGGSAFTVDLEAGTWALEWRNANNGAIEDGGTVDVGGGTEQFEADFSGDAVLVLTRQ